MEEMWQGDDYNEYGFDETIEEKSVEGGEETAERITSIYGIPIKYLVIGGITLLIIILITVGINFTSKGERYAEPQNDVVQQTVPPVIYEPVTDTQQYPQDAAPTAIEQSKTLDDLSDEEYQLLRKYGYNADEISLALEWGFDINALVEASMALQDEASKESLQRVSDTAGEEYKTLLHSTYLGQPEITVDDQRGVPAEELVSEVKIQTINADYTKCQTRGVQLLLKCKIGDNTYFWYPVTPQRWVTLPDAGNIVLELTLSYYGDDVFVIDATEANETLDTINAENTEVNTSG